MDIGGAIRAGRNALGLTQDQLGSMSSLTRQAVALAEKNAGRVSTLEAIRKHVPLSTRGLPTGEHIGAQLRIVREEKGLSLREAAARAALAVNTLRDVEQGKGSIVSLRRVAAALSPKARIVFAKNRSLAMGFVTVGRRTSRVTTLLIITQLQHPSSACSSTTKLSPKVMRFWSQQLAKPGQLSVCS